MHRRFIRWRDKGVWEKLLSLLINEPDDEWPMIDASHCKVHPHAAGVKGGLAGSLGGVLVTPRLDQDIQHVAVLIHGPPQTPPAMLKLSVPNEHANALRLNVVSRLSRVFNLANLANLANLSDRPRIGRESV